MVIKFPLLSWGSGKMKCVLLPSVQIYIKLIHSQLDIWRKFYNLSCFLLLQTKKTVKSTGNWTWAETEKNLVTILHNVAPYFHYNPTSNKYFLFIIETPLNMLKHYITNVKVIPPSMRPCLTPCCRTAASNRIPPMSGNLLTTLLSVVQKKHLSERTFHKKVFTFWRWSKRHSFINFNGVSFYSR